MGATIGVMTDPRPRLDQAPREIPPGLRLRLMAGGFMTQVGWACVAGAVVVFAVVVAGVSLAAEGLAGLLGGAIALFGLGGAFAVAGVVEGRRQIWFLRHGRETRGTLISKTIVDAGESTTYELTFDYPITTGERHRVTLRTDDVARLEDDAAEPMVYDPRQPGRAMPIDHLPGAPRITEAGRVAWRVSGLGLVLPGLALASVLALGVVVALVALGT